MRAIIADIVAIGDSYDISQYNEQESNKIGYELNMIKLITDVDYSFKHIIRLSP